MTTSIKSVATKGVASVPVGANVSQALDLMREKRIRHLPVVDALDTYVGVLSQKDLVNLANPETLPVEIFMSSPVEWIDHKASLRTAILRMLEKKISCLLIANESDTVVGIVTTDDLLWYLAHLLKDEKDEGPSLKEIVNLQFIGEIANKLSNLGI